MRADVYARTMNVHPEVLHVSDLKKAFAGPDGNRRLIVDVPDFSLAAGEHLALRGESGSGKTTFLNLIAGILAADSGAVRLGDANMVSLGEHARDRLRGEQIGYVFQTFNLLQGYTCLENVLLGMTFGGKADRYRARSLLERVGLASRIGHFPRQLSTGQQQRVAVARALAKRPRLVLADEPTGNLDPANGREVLKLIRETCAENGAALILVSHDPEVLKSVPNVRDFAGVNRAQREGAQP